MTVETLERHVGATDGRAALTDVLDLALAALAEPVPGLTVAGRWRVAGARGGIEVRAALGDTRPVWVQRLTRLAAGPALLAVRLAVAVTGRRPYTTLFPEPAHPRILAVVRQGTAGPPTQAERALFAVLVRGPRTGDVPAPDVRAVLPLLRCAVDAEGAWLHTVSDPADRERLATSLTPVRDADPDDELLVLGSHHHSPAGDLQAGQAMQRVLLTARFLGLDAAVLADPSELAGRRSADVPGAGPGLLPQIVLCVGRNRREPGGGLMGCAGAVRR